MSERFLGKHLSGELPSRATQPPQLSPDGETRRVAEFQKTMEIASRLGQICEDNVLKAWAGGLEISQPYLGDLEEALTEVSAQLSFVEERTYSHQELTRLYQKLGASFFSREEARMEPENDALWNLLVYIEDIYKVDFIEIYNELAEYGEKIRPQMRYLIEAAIILGKEALHPLPWPGVLIPNIRVYDRGKILTQVDAVMTPITKAHQSWLFPSEGEGDFLWNRGHFPQEAPTYPYDMIEIKTPFGASVTTGQKKFRRPVKKHLRSFQHRLGEIALWWKNQREGSFPFPSNLHLVYLRGSLPHVVHRVPLDSVFFEEWIKGLNKKRVLIELFFSQETGGVFVPDDLAQEIPMIQLKHAEIQEMIEILAKAQAVVVKREKKERREKEARMRERLERLKEEQGEEREQGILFERPSVGNTPDQA